MIRPVSAIRPDSLEYEVLQAARGLLDEAFGVPFEFWTRDDGWRRVAPESSDEDAAWVVDPTSDPDVDLLSRAVTEPVVAADTSGGWVVAVPVRWDGQTPFVALGRSPTGSAELLDRISRSFVREFAQRRQLHRCRQQLENARDENELLAAQTSDNLEELTFLRGLLGNMEVAEAHIDLGQIAETVLPPLAEAIQADTLVLVKAEQELSFAAEVRVGRVVYRTGEASPLDEVCCRLADAFRDAACRSPVVRNHFDGEADFPGVFDFILAPLAKGERVVGWLLALNRSNRDECEDGDLTHRVGRFEFGSEEASLLGATASLLATQVRNVELFHDKERLLVNVVRAIVAAIDAKDPYTTGKSERVAQSAARLGRELGLSEESCDRLYLTGLLHDIGTLGISEATLRKPGRLTAAELAEMRSHPRLGWNMLRELQQLKYVLPGVITHHERFDGKGYPDGLAGEAIPLEGRILAVADAFDAMVSDRSYRQGLPPSEAAEILREGAGAQWDPRVVHAFLRVQPEIFAICS